MEIARPSIIEQELFDRHGIKLGYPALSQEQAQAYQDFDFEVIDMPYQPHVFFTPQISLETWKKQRRATITPLTTLENVMIIIGHGQTYMDSGQEQWKFFGTQKPVEETVREYQKFAKEYKLPPVDIVLSCRGDKIVSPLPPQSGTIEVRKAPAPIKVHKEFAYPYIFPNDFVGASGIIKEGVVESVRGITEHWQGLREWQGYWSRNQRTLPENIPQLFKRPSRTI